MSIPIVPAIIPNSAAAVISLLEQLPSARELQLDVVDGQYVPTISWPYQPAGAPMEVAHATDAVTLEVDLMVREPLPAARNWVSAGADMIVFHYGTISLEAFTTFVDTATVSVGIASHGPFGDNFFDYVAVADYVQLMGIRTIGAQGQPFDDEVLDRVRMLRQVFPGKMISVDGSVNEKTVRALKEAGVHRMIVGSAIVQQENPDEALRLLQRLIND